MARSSRGKQPNSPGADGDDILNILNVIYREFGANAELQTFVSLDGRLFVEATCDVLIEGQPLVHLSYGRFSGGNNPPYMTVCMIVLHNLYHELDRYHLRAGGLGVK